MPDHQAVAKSLQAPVQGPAAPAPEFYRLNPDSHRGGRILGALLEDPLIAMSEAQRSRFLGAVLHAQRAYESEVVENVFAIEDIRLMNLADDRVARQIGERLAAEVAEFLSPEQMAQLRGRISFPDFVKIFFQADAIVAEGQR